MPTSTSTASCNAVIFRVLFALGELVPFMQFPVFVDPRSWTERDGPSVTASRMRLGGGEERQGFRKEHVLFRGLRPPRSDAFRPFRSGLAFNLDFDPANA